MSNYISKSELVETLKNHPNVFEQFGHTKNIALEDVVATIKELPTVDEKEIIRKSMERIVAGVRETCYQMGLDESQTEILIDEIKEEGAE